MHVAWLEFAAGLFTGAFLAALVVLNIHHYRRRRSMTPEERAREDEELREEMSIW